MSENAKFRPCKKNLIKIFIRVFVVASELSGSSENSFIICTGIWERGRRKKKLLNFIAIHIRIGKS